MGILLDGDSCTRAHTAPAACSNSCSCACSRRVAGPAAEAAARCAAPPALSAPVLSTATDRHFTSAQSYSDGLASPACLRKLGLQLGPAQTHCSESGMQRRAFAQNLGTARGKCTRSVCSSWFRLPPMQYGGCAIASFCSSCFRLPTVRAHTLQHVRPVNGRGSE